MRADLLSVEVFSERRIAELSASLHTVRKIMKDTFRVESTPLHRSKISEKRILYRFVGGFLGKCFTKFGFTIEDKKTK
ncbi:hypothetical protein DRJ25_03045 [Candidatus Woesearchaeota archaeon]|nr:MAG: hypothetical protein DRJ25_03045 [Candidatus Woesearchaeota archaeon]